ncbi:MAG: antitoxin of toxin-antitoxin stability system [Kiloniellaceae bacterium]
MPKDQVFTFKLESELRKSFTAEAEALDRPASQVLRELMRSFVQERQELRDYDSFVREKVAEGDADVAAGRILSHAQVKQRAGNRRARLQQRDKAAKKRPE